MSEKAPVRRILCILLILVSVPALLLFPAIRLSGERAEIFRTNVNREVSDALDVTKDVLLHDDSFDREAIAAAGVDLREERIAPFFDAVSKELECVTDCELSPADLLRTTLLAQKAMPTAEKLSATPATEGLCVSLGIDPAVSQYQTYGRYASLGLIAYEALLGLIVLCALGSILFSVFKRSKVFDALLLIFECILVLPFVGGTVAGNLFLASIDMQEKLRLLPGWFAIGAIAAVIVVLILKATLPKKAKN